MYRWFMDVTVNSAEALIVAAVKLVSVAIEADIVVVPVVFWAV